jgi:hypothetical protein
MTRIEEIKARVEKATPGPWAMISRRTALTSSCATTALLSSTMRYALRTAWRHKENSMTTKPEGPAQECPVCLETPCSHFHNAAPATPAPSQPAGAREKNWLVEAVENCPDPVLKLNCKQLLANDYTNAAVQFIADAQTAAKDAEIARIDNCAAQLLKQLHETQVALELAERERDSLRDENAALKVGKDGQK